MKYNRAQEWLFYQRERKNERRRERKGKINLGENQAPHHRLHHLGLWALHITSVIDSTDGMQQNHAALGLGLPITLLQTHSATVA